MNDLGFSSTFDGGNGRLVRYDATTGIADIEINPDPGGETQPFLQWFYFRLWGAPGTTLTLRLINAGQAAYPKGWVDYPVRLRHGDKDWHCQPTRYEDGVLSWTGTLTGGWLECAYFVPYPQPRLDNLLAWASRQGAERLHLATTAEGRPVEGLRAGTPGGPPLWIIARQHPGETMASWAAEGFLRALFDPSRDSSRRLLAEAEVFVVPNMNPDGAVNGFLRTNRTGTNLNRAWQNLDPVAAPEVAGVWQAMTKSGVARFLDLHGDEALPYVFTAGCEGVPGFGEGPEGEAWAQRQQAFRDALETINPAYQQRFGYPVAPRGRGNLTMATAAVAHRFRCPAFTLEMPFKDDQNAPDREVGWSPQRSQGLGADLVAALYATLHA